MNIPKRLNDLGQSLWMNKITDDMMNVRGINHAIEAWKIKGLVYHPDTFKDTIINNTVYDAAIVKKLREGFSGEDLYFEIVMKELRNLADIFLPIFENSKGMDGWLTVQMSPIMTYDSGQVFNYAKDLYVRLQRPNFFISISGTEKNLIAIEESILAGVPLNIVNIFSHRQYLSAAEAFLRGIERRVKAGIRPNVHSVVSCSVSQWDDDLLDEVPDWLSNQLGIAVARQIYMINQDFLTSHRWRRVNEAGAIPQRIAWVDTEPVNTDLTKGFYIKELVAPLTVSVMSEKSLRAFGDKVEMNTLMPRNGGNSSKLLRRVVRAGIDIDLLADKFQEKADASFFKSWIDLLTAIADKSSVLLIKKKDGTF